MASMDVAVHVDHFPTSPTTTPGGVSSNPPLSRRPPPPVTRYLPPHTRPPSDEASAGSGDATGQPLFLATVAAATDQPATSSDNPTPTPPLPASQRPGRKRPRPASRPNHSPREDRVRARHHSPSPEPENPNTATEPETPTLPATAPSDNATAPETATEPPTPPATTVYEDQGVPPTDSPLPTESQPFLVVRFDRLVGFDPLTEEWHLLPDPHPPTGQAHPGTTHQGPHGPPTGTPDGSSS